MKKVNLAAVPVDENESSKDRVRLFRQDISAAIRAGDDEKAHGAPHPFAVELVRLPPSAVNWPYHSPSAQWEFYMVVAGRGQVRTPAGTVEVREGDCFVHPPGESHQVTNTGAVDLVYYVIANKPRTDSVQYLDGKKWMLVAQSNPVNMTTGYSSYMAN